MENQSLSSHLSRRDALKIGLKGSAYAAPVILGVIVATPAGAVSATSTMRPVGPTATATISPTPTSTPGTAVITVSPTSGIAGSPFTITLANFPASASGNVSVQGNIGGFFSRPVMTDTRGNATVVFKDLGTPSDTYTVSAYLGTSVNSNQPTIQITAPGLIGAVTVASAGGCNPTVVNGSGFPTGADFSVNFTSPSGTNLGGFNTIQAQANGAFQLFATNIGLPTGSLRVVVSARQNVLNTTPFTQVACTGNSPYVYADTNSIIAGDPFTFSGNSFTPGSMLTVSARSSNGTLLGSTSVTALTVGTQTQNAGSISGTLSTMGFPVGDITLVATPTGSNTVLAASTARIV